MMFNTGGKSESLMFAQTKPVSTLFFNKLNIGPEADTPTSTTPATVSNTSVQGS